MSAPQSDFPWHSRRGLLFESGIPANGYRIDSGSICHSFHLPRRILQIAYSLDLSIPSASVWQYQPLHGGELLSRIARNGFLSTAHDRFYGPTRHLGTPIRLDHDRLRKSLSHLRRYRRNKSRYLDRLYPSDCFPKRRSNHDLGP